MRMDEQRVTWEVLANRNVAQSKRRLTCWGHCRVGSWQAEAVVDVGRQQVVAAVMVLVALQVLVDLVDQQCHSFKGSPA